MAVKGSIAGDWNEKLDIQKKIGGFRLKDGGLAKRGCQADCNAINCVCEKGLVLNSGVKCREGEEMGDDAG